MTLTVPHSRKIFYRCFTCYDIFIAALLAMINLYTKFEVHTCTRYEAMNGGAKCTNWDSLGRLWVTQGHRQCYQSIERMRLPIRL